MRPTPCSKATDAWSTIPAACTIEIVRWPAQGWRAVDEDSGDEGGTTQGVFVSQWRGDVLYGRNEAVDGHYVLAYAGEPSRADESHDRVPERMLLWHCNYHPDGGQLFFPLERSRSTCRSRCRATTCSPSSSYAFASTAGAACTSIPACGTRACSLRSGTQRFFDQQGAVHARVSIDFAREFGCLLEANF